MNKRNWLKLIVAAMAIFMVLSVVACTEENGNGGTSSGTTSTPAEESTTESTTPGGSDTTETTVDTGSETTETTSESTSETTETESESTDSPCTHDWVDDADETNHWTECDICGEKKDIATHTWTTDWEKNGTKHWKECTACGEIKESADHTVVETDFKSDAVNHWNECSVCGQATNVVTHAGNLVNNGDGTHTKVCTTCNKAFEDAVAHVFGFGVSQVSHACVCGATEPCENGPFVLEHNDTEHWYTASCDKCGVTTEHEAHIWAYGEKSRKCEKCGYEETCDVDHMTYSEGLDGKHWYKEACEICNITEGSEAEGEAHKFVSAGNNSCTCSVCGYKYVCTDNHYENTAEGHKIVSACVACGITEDMIMTEAVPHDKVEGTEDPAYTLWTTEADGKITYAIACPTCGYAYSSRTVTNEVNYYSAPFQLVNRWNTTNADGLVFGNGDGRALLTDVRIDETEDAYTRVHLQNYGEFYFTNGTAPAGNHNEADTIDKVQGGVGKYAVLKIRFSKNGTWSFKLETDTGKMATIDRWMLPNKSGWPGVNAADGKFTSAEWGILLIDLEKMGLSDPNATAIRAMFRHIGNVDPNHYVDVAYFAICDDMAEVASVVGDENATLHYTAWVEGDESAVDVSGACIGECKPVTVEENVVYKDGSDANVCYTYDSVTYKCSVSCCSNSSVEESRVASTKTHDIKQTAGEIILGASEHGNCWSATSTDTCTREKCGYEAEGMTGGDHIYGKATGETVGTNVVWTTTCTTEGCSHAHTVTVPAGLNFFSAPGNVINNWGATATQGGASGAAGTAMTEVLEENGVVFTRVYKANDWASFCLTDGKQTGYKVDSSIIDTLNNGIGKYVVIKIRSSGDGNKNITFKIKTDKADYFATGARSIGNGDFQTIVIDISKFEDATATKVRFHMSLASSSYVDIAYAAICADIEQVEKLVGTDKFTWCTDTWVSGANYTNWKLFEIAQNPTAVVPVACEHTGFALVHAEGTKYIYACTDPTCAGIKVVNGIEGLNYYSVPGQLVNNWGANTANNGDDVIIGDVIEEDGVLFTRLSPTGWGSFWIGNGSVDASAHPQDTSCVDLLTNGMGKFLVVKIRSAGIGTNFKITTDTGKTLTTTGPKDLKSSWATIIMDISELQDADAKKVGIWMQTRGGVASLDIAYLAICDDLSMLEKVVGTDEIMWIGTGWSNSVNVNYKDWNAFNLGQYPENATTIDCDHSEFTLIYSGNNKYIYTCDTADCNGVKVVTVPEEMNYYSAPGQSVNLWATTDSSTDKTATGTASAFQVLEEDGVLFSRAYSTYTEADLWSSFYVANGTATPTGGDNLTGVGNNTLSQGMGKYLVMKVRGGINAQLFLVTGKEGAIQTAFGGTSKWIPSEWTTIVLDVSALEAADAETLKVVFKFSGVDKYIDVAYLAVCNTTDQIQQLVGSDRVMWGSTAWRNDDADNGVTGYQTVYNSWDDLYNTEIKVTE